MQHSIADAEEVIVGLKAEIERLRDMQTYDRQELARLVGKIERLMALLTRCETVLENMALENDLSISRRWPINHEPLRADAKNLLPEVRACVGEEMSNPDTVKARSARARIAELEAEIERLKAALREIAAAYDGEQDDYDLTQTMIGIARAALEGK